MPESKLRFASATFLAAAAPRGTREIANRGECDWPSLAWSIQAKRIEAPEWELEDNEDQKATEQEKSSGE